MIPILYDASETLFASNGRGRLRDCISCRATEGRNDVFELDFEYPVTGAHFDEITEGRIIYATHDETGIPQPFDIVGSTKPLSGVVTFHAVHISYRQLYLTATGSNINSLADALALFATATPSNPFSYDADFTSTAYMSAADGTPRSVRQMLGGIEGSVLDAYGGELEFDRFAVHLRSARGVRRDFAIRYGVNLLDYNEETDFTGVYTSCIPFWRGQNDSGQEVTVVGSQVSVGAASYCGRDLCVPLDLSEKFEDKPTRAQVEAMALSVMQSRQVNLPARNIRVDFVRLQDMPEFSQFERLLECNLCDTVGVVFPRYNMSGEFKIVKTVFNVLKDRYEEMELGALSTSLSEALGITETPNNDRVNENFYVDSDGNITSNGTIMVGGHSSPIGTVITAHLASAKSASPSTATEVCSISLPQGTWALVGYVRFPSNNSGLRRASFDTSVSDSIHIQQTAAQGGVTQVQVEAIVEVTATSQTWHLNAWHNSTTTLNLPAGTNTGYINGIRAVRIA